MNLSFKSNYLIEEEHDRVSCSGKLKCDCGCDEFFIEHTGKQTRGIFSPYIKKENKQILVSAKCSLCGKEILIYDTTKDGLKPVMVEHMEKKEFVYKDINKFKVKIVLNYYEENYMTNKFFTIYIYLFDNNGKQIVLYEE